MDEAPFLTGVSTLRSLKLMKDKRMGRPPAEAVNVQRWTGRRWVLDDGKPGQAFVGQSNGGTPFAWTVDMEDPAWKRERQFAARAISYACSIWQCANGRKL